MAISPTRTWEVGPALCASINTDAIGTSIPYVLLPFCFAHMLHVSMEIQESLHI